MSWWPRRPHNSCYSCGHGWHPRGHNISLRCPNCNSENVGITPIVAFTRGRGSCIGCLILFFAIVVPLFGVLALFSFCIRLGINGSGSDHQSVASTNGQLPPPAAIHSGDRPDQNTTGNAGGTAETQKATDQKRTEESARKAKEEADAKAQTEAKRKAEAERNEKAMVGYELAKIVYHAGSRLSLGRKLAADADAEAFSGHGRESERLMGKAKAHYNEVIDRYPQTEAAEEAKQLLEGKNVPRRAVPTAPSLPKGITASDENLADKPKPPVGPVAEFDPIPSDSVVIPPGISLKLVYVRGYTRLDGVFVAPHYRMLKDIVSSRP
jgi:hypothetical protein